MTVWFVSRHPGAIDWARQQGLQIDRWVTHLDTGAPEPGDTIIGSLPAGTAAELCARGIRYLHLQLDLPEEWRGRELTKEQLVKACARLIELDVQVVAPEASRTGIAGE